MSSSAARPPPAHQACASSPPHPAPCSPQQAIRIDEPVADSATTSMVDDAFFVLLKAGRRSMGTGKAPSVVAILNQINAVLSGLYRGALASKLAGAAGRLAAAAPPEPGEPAGPGAAAAAAAFNNADVSASYVGKLRQQLEDLAGQLFHQANDRDRIKLVGGVRGPGEWGASH